MRVAKAAAPDLATTLRDLPTQIAFRLDEVLRYDKAILFVVIRLVSSYSLKLIQFAWKAVPEPFC